MHNLCMSTRLSKAAAWVPGTTLPPRRACLSSAAKEPSPAATATVQLAPQYDPVTWPAAASSLLSSLGLPSTTTPQQLWQHLAQRSPFLDNQGQQQQQQQQQQPQQQQLLQLDVSSCRLLMSAAAATCSTQQQLNQLRPLLAAAPAAFPGFELADFRQLLQLCAQARYVPDKEWLASAYYADTGGFERFYKQEPPESLVLLLSDLSAALHSDRALLAQRAALLNQQASRQQQQPSQQAGGSSHPTSAHDPIGATPAAAAAAAAEAVAVASAGSWVQDSDSLSTELHAVEVALESAVQNLAAIYQDGLLAGELSAVAGFWLLRRFLPALQQQPQMVLRGLCALPGLRYQVLDGEDADLLLATLTAQLPYWSTAQWATAAMHALPCLADKPPTEGHQLALLFAAFGNAAELFTPEEAEGLLFVLAELPGYAPDAQVAQALLVTAVQPPLDRLTGRRLKELLTVAEELGAAPTVGL